MITDVDHRSHGKCATKTRQNARKSRLARENNGICKSCSNPVTTTKQCEVCKPPQKRRSIRSQVRRVIKDQGIDANGRPFQLVATLADVLKVTTDKKHRKAIRDCISFFGVALTEG